MKASKTENRFQTDWNPVCQKNRY